MTFSEHALALDAAVTTQKIAQTLETLVLRELRKRGSVVGLSGGIDSSVTAALAVSALGRERVLGLLMPENDSDPDSLRLGKLVASTLGIETVTEDITPTLEALDCYRRRDEAIKQVIPEYGFGWRAKIVLPDVTDGRYRIFSVVAEAPDGTRVSARLTPSTYLQIVAATNFKQRTRKMLEYYHADRLNYAVLGTPNRLEYDQGFFVKSGDGAADVKPIAHLYKTQVYALAAHLDLPAQVRERPPTTDTYALAQSQEEFYFSLPYAQMDLCLYAHNQRISSRDVATTLGLKEAQVESVYRDIESKRRGTRALHLPPLLVEPIPEIKLGAH
jgi:NAD+ synthase